MKSVRYVIFWLSCSCTCSRLFHCCWCSTNKRMLLFPICFVYAYMHRLECSARIRVLHCFTLFYVVLHHSSKSFCRQKTYTKSTKTKRVTQLSQRYKRITNITTKLRQHIGKMYVYVKKRIIIFFNITKTNKKTNTCIFGSGNIG